MNCVIMKIRIILIGIAACSTIVTVKAKETDTDPDILYNQAQFYNVGDWWIEGEVEWDWSDRTDKNWDYSLHKYVVENDTVIKGIQYVSISKQVFRRYEQQNTTSTKQRNVFFLREDYSGKQYIRIPSTEEDYLIWDFGTNLKDEAYITCGTININDDSPSYQQKQIEINNIEFYELKNGCQTEIYNDAIVKGFGNISSGIAYNLGETDWEYMNSEFLIRCCKNEIVLQNEGLLFALTDMMGSDFINQLTETPSIIASIYFLNPYSTIFDLTGRRLNSVPEKGIYIKNGRKWLRK